MTSYFSNTHCLYHTMFFDIKESEEIKLLACDNQFIAQITNRGKTNINKLINNLQNMYKQILHILLANIFDHLP